MRKLPDIQPPETLTHRQIDLIKQTREYKLITPLFGGGVTPAEADPVTIIRASEIRGHLRFWWRATRGGQFGGDLARMKEREDKIWGKAYKKEKKVGAKNENAEKEDITVQRTVQIEIVIGNAGENRKPFKVEPNKKLRPLGVPEYAAFPLRPPNDDLRQKTPAQIEQEMKGVRHNVHFFVKLIYPQEYEADIQAALWAWETFGGIGARTRRGFGALQLLEVNGEQAAQSPASSRQEDVKTWLNQQARIFVVSGVWPRGVPHLEQTLSCELSQSEAQVLHCWDRLIGIYKSFRQSRTNGNAGRSNWPEAETIRQKTGRRAQTFDKQTGRKKNKYPPLGHPEKFPRAAFGLPILFHFKDEKDGDPPDTTLQGKESENERLASPLILRPLVCGNRRAIGLAVLLKGSQLPPLALKDVNKPADAQIDKSDLAKLEQLNKEKLKGETDVLQAFLNSLGGRR